MLLDIHGILKIADFAGSSVVRSAFPPSVDYEVGSKLPGESEPTIRTDIFALGSAIYEMVTGRPPYKGRPYAEVQMMFMEDRFPQDFENVPELQPIVEKCWMRCGSFYNRAEEVLADFYALSSPPSRPSNIYANVPKVVRQKTHSSPTIDPPVKVSSKLSRKVHKERKTPQTYADSRRNRKESRKCYINDKEKETGRRHSRKRHQEDPVSQLVQSFRILWSGHSRLSQNKRRYYA